MCRESRRGVAERASMIEWGMEILREAWQVFWELLGAAGNLATLIVVISTIAGIVLWTRGLLPVVFRLGSGLRRRKVAIFAKANSLHGLRGLLEDSRLFNTKNLIDITSAVDFGRAENASVFLVQWPDWELPEKRSILDRKADATALIVYAPQAAGLIPPEEIRLLEQQRNAVLCNFRGRLLNDIVTSMITTAYEKKDLMLCFDPMSAPTSRRLMGSGSLFRACTTRFKMF